MRAFAPSIAAALASVLLTATAAAPARAEETGALLLYGPVKFESRSDLGTGNRVVVIDAAAAGGCEALAWQAKLVLDQAASWIAQRRAGSRRIAASDLVFFQFRGLSFRMPYEEKAREEERHFYDAFEMLGYFHSRWKAEGCGRSKPPFVPAWPFGTRAWPADEAAITFTGLDRGRRLYVESFRGYPTDVYYCRKTVPAAELEKLRQKLLGVRASRRIEDSSSFRAYTQAREAVCGES